MATIGLKYVAWGKIANETESAIPTYDAGFVLGKAVSANLTINNAEAELYADDMLAEYVSEFTSADLSMDVDNISLEKQATVYGATYNDGEMKAASTDNAPNGGIGGYQVLMVNGEKKYRAWFFPKAKASIPDWTGNTKGQSVSFGTQPIKAKIASPKFGPWYYIKEFTTEVAAKAYIDTKLGVATWYTIDVQVNGAGVGEDATPVGVNAVASAGAFELAITGTPSALYDNGTDAVTSIAGGKYTLTNVTVNHTIAVIF